MVDLEKSEKLPKDKRYFNISIIWIFYFRQVIKLFYFLRIRHEIITITSILFGLLSAFLFLQGKFIWAAVALHLKDIFDASDGAIARLTGTGHLIGRYLDSIGDFISLTAVMLAIGFHYYGNGQTIVLYLSIAAIFSTFIQCSFFNYYQLKYVAVFGINTLLSQTDESERNASQIHFNTKTALIIYRLMHILYLVIYAWQDRLVERVEQKLASGLNLPDRRKYENQSLMTGQSALCFGTHIFAIMIGAIVGHPDCSLFFITTVMNLYLVSLLYLRKRYYILCAKSGAKIGG